MDEASARRVLAVHAFDATSADEHPLWSAEDRAWATRVALETVGADAPLEDFVAARARAALQRLSAREPGLAHWLVRPAGSAGVTAWLLLACLLAGAVLHGMAETQYINLLAPPVWAVVAWNLAVYALLAWRGLARPRPGPPGRWMRVLGRLTGSGWVAPKPLIAQRAAAPGGASASRAALTALTAAWAREGAPLWLARLARSLHLAAAALAIGLAAGLYLRGLVLDYRVGWQSTFLDATAVHTALSALLAPASALTGVALPDAPALAALQLTPGAQALASAAPWIHLYAATLALFVVLPRLALALASGWRARRLSRRFPLRLDPAYLQALRRQQRSRTARVRVLPHAQAPSAQAVLGLRALLARALGETARIEIAPALPFGDEADAPLTVARPDADHETDVSVVLFDLSATPEPEHQAELLRRMARTAAPLLAVLDESAFVRRFGAGSARHAERRRAWRELLLAQGLQPLFVELESPDAPAKAHELEQCLHAATPGAAAASGAPDDHE